MGNDNVALVCPSLALRVWLQFYNRLYLFVYLYVEAAVWKLQVPQTKFK